MIGTKLFEPDRDKMHSQNRVTFAMLLSLSGVYEVYHKCLITTSIMLLSVPIFDYSICFSILNCILVKKVVIEFSEFKNMFWLLNNGYMSSDLYWTDLPPSFDWDRASHFCPFADLYQTDIPPSIKGGGGCSSHSCRFEIDFLVLLSYTDNGEL